MHMMLITGGVNAGKSYLLHTFRSLRNIFLIDPLAVDVTTARAWSEPNPGIKIVAFDHIGDLANASAQVRAAMAWCEANGATLYLCDKEREDIEALDIEIPDTALELNMNITYTVKVKGRCAELGDEVLAASCLTDLSDRVLCL